jgi:hypothetical protein
LNKAASRIWHGGKALFRPGTKKPLAGFDKGFFATRAASGSAAGTATGTGTATAATTESVGGSDGETGTVSGVDEIDLDGPASFQQIAVHQKFQTAFLK